MNWKDSEVQQKKLNLLFPEHHLSHAASAFYPLPFLKKPPFLLLTAWANGPLPLFAKETEERLRYWSSWTSWFCWLFVFSFTYYLGFKNWTAENINWWVSALWQSGWCTNKTVCCYYKKNLLPFSTMAPFTSTRIISTMLLVYEW